ncbi:eukaryotic translation initiation factor 3 subunit A-like [Papaver somniferum]|uniref:eukaryotic translation initiation factor 3 subunit A-like n=1 Tax=Papaver somniferum TaxID=3469 RepID=UPI000E6F51FA|nr:eukaryotic translation initiation factor 3 subunit A-like [Papaver somniferum]
MAEPIQPAVQDVVENQSPILENEKQATHALTSEEAERLISYLEQEIPNKRMQEEENRRHEEFDRQRIENEEEYQFWIRKYEARCARKRREMQERMERLEHHWIKTRSATESESDEEGGEAVEFDEDDSNSVSTDPEKEARKKRRHEREMQKMYLLYLAEKAQPRIFARTMSEPLNVDSDGEEIPGMDVDGNPIKIEVQKEENEGSEDDEDGGYGHAASTSTDSGVDFSYEEDGFNTGDDDDQRALGKSFEEYYEYLHFLKS